MIGCFLTGTVSESDPSVFELRASDSSDSVAARFCRFDGFAAAPVEARFVAGFGFDAGAAFFTLEGGAGFLSFGGSDDFTGEDGSS